MPGANQNKFLGTLLGMGIGDALGMPVAGRTPAEIEREFGRVETYLPRPIDAETSIQAGEFTDESEIALCMVEAATANDGQFDPNQVGPRMLFLARGESKRWMHPDTLRALNEAEETHSFRKPLDDDGPATPDVAVRGVPVGLMYAVGRKRGPQLLEDAENVVRITHGSPLAISGATAIALSIALVARKEMETSGWSREVAHFLADGELRRVLLSGTYDADDQSMAAVVTAALEDAATSRTFDEAVIRAVNRGGPTDTRGALTGALAGARFGADGIPQRLIDGCEGRIYVSLAAPWFYRAAHRRAGTALDIKRRLD